MKLPITLKPVKNRAETLNFGKFLNIFSEFKEGLKLITTTHLFFYYYFLIEIHSIQGWAGTTK